MKRTVIRKQRRQRRKRGLRKRIFGTPQRPRLSIYRSLKHTYAQVIDDLSGHTLAFASTNEKSLKAEGSGNAKAAAEIGKRIAERAKEKGVSNVVFDRNGYRYHGRVKALADAARKGGLSF